MSLYVYRPLERVFLAEDEKSWTPSILEAASFTSRDLAGQIAERQLGPTNDAFILDDGIDA